MNKNNKIKKSEYDSNSILVNPLDRNGSELEDKRMKQMKQERYRRELEQQMKQQQIQNMNGKRTQKKSQQNEHGINGMGAVMPSFLDSMEDKRAKQEKYRRELMEQMASHQNKEKSSSTGPLGRGQNSFISALPMGSHAENAEEIKKRKQEEYRRELEQQMKEHQRQQRQMENCGVAGTSAFYEMKEAEETNEEQKQQQYAMQLEEQMRLRKLSEVAEKERQLLEDRKMVFSLWKSSFLYLLVLDRNHGWKG